MLRNIFKRKYYKNCTFYINMRIGTRSKDVCEYFEKGIPNKKAFFDWIIEQQEEFKREMKSKELTIMDLRIIKPF